MIRPINPKNLPPARMAKRIQKEEMPRESPRIFGPMTNQQRVGLQ